MSNKYSTKALEDAYNQIMEAKNEIVDKMEEVFTGPSKEYVNVLRGSPFVNEKDMLDRFKKLDIRVSDERGIDSEDIKKAAWDAFQRQYEYVTAKEEMGLAGFAIKDAVRNINKQSEIVSEAIENLIEDQTPHISDDISEKLYSDDTPAEDLDTLQTVLKELDTLEQKCFDMKYEIGDSVSLSEYDRLIEDINEMRSTVMEVNEQLIENGQVEYETEEKAMTGLEKLRSGYFKEDKSRDMGDRYQDGKDEYDRDDF